MYLPQKHLNSALVKLVLSLSERLLDTSVTVVLNVLHLKIVRIVGGFV